MGIIQSIHGNEWSLIVFTILAQMGVGTFIIREVIHFLAIKKYGTESVHQTADASLLAIGATMILATIVSFFHLGNPLKAYRALTNLGSSWLSREILFVLLFTAAVLVLIFLKWLRIIKPAVRRWVVFLAGLAGLALIFCMTWVYMLPTVPVWNNPFTPLSFWTTTFLLGSLATTCGFAMLLGLYKRRTAVSNNRKIKIEFSRYALRFTAFIALILIGLELLQAALFTTYLANAGNTAGRSLQLLGGHYSILVLRLLLLMTGAGLLFFVLYQNRAVDRKIPVKNRLVFIAFLAVLGAEVMGRYLFYALYASAGV